jgi:hypothetical protein
MARVCVKVDALSVVDLQRRLRSLEVCLVALAVYAEKKWRKSI